MKYISIALVILVSSCTGNPPIKNNTVIEEAVMWKAKIDPSWVSIDLSKLLSDTKKFTPQGNFFKVNIPVYAFDHKVLYVGVMGYQMTSGPNITVEGSPDTIVKSILKKYKIKMKPNKSGENYYHILKKDFTLIVAKHPERKGRSVIIGAYSGL